MKKKHHNHLKRISYCLMNGYIINRYKRLVAEGFSEYLAKKYGTAIFHFTDDSYVNNSSAITTTKIVKEYLLQKKDRQKLKLPKKSPSTRVRLEDIQKYFYSFNSSGELARAIQNFIRKRIQLKGSYNPRKKLYRANQQLFLNKTGQYKLEKLKEGTILEVDTILCTSSDQKIAEEFLIDPDDVLMVFQKGISTAVSVEDLSQIGNEKEVLIGPGIQIKLIHKEYIKLPYIKEKNLCLTFEEVKKGNRWN